MIVQERSANGFGNISGTRGAWDSSNPLMVSLTPRSDP